MPTPSAAQRFLARVTTRSPHGNRAECTAVIGGVAVATGADGLPLTGYYFEQDAQDEIENKLVIVSQPWAHFDRSDLPGVPRRGDTVTFDDGTYRVLYALDRGAAFDVALSPPPPGDRRP